MKITAFNFLPKESEELRKEVFMVEQGFTDEFDGVDERCVHLLATEGKEAVATCRLYFDEGFGAHLVGRICVKRAFRGKGIGSRLLEEAFRIVKEKGGKELILHAQLQAVPFYEKFGFIPFGEKDTDEGRFHIWMKKAV